jgi:hypothetical protein
MNGAIEIWAISGGDLKNVSTLIELQTSKWCNLIQVVLKRSHKNSHNLNEPFRRGFLLSTHSSTRRAAAAATM